MHPQRLLLADDFPLPLDWLANHGGANADAGHTPSDGIGAVIHQV
jgi:hypothetical protein